MRAWEIELETIKNSIPIILSDEEQMWTALGKIEEQEDFKLRLLWKSNVPGSGATEHLIIGAIQSVENMGYRVEEAEKLIDKGIEAYVDNDMNKLNKITARIFFLLNNPIKDEKSDYWRYKIYSNHEEYERNIKVSKNNHYNLDVGELMEKIKWGWTAQICGGSLGTAIEGYNTENLRNTFGEIKGYVRTPNTYNDDITYEIAFLKAFENKGYSVTSIDIAEEWVGLIPSGWSAEEIALKNIKSGIYPPESGCLNNPYREWIGAQMRGSICGMVAPGDPKEAARLAFTDGVISHYNNGVLGEVFNAVMTSLAFVERNVKIIIESAMDLIPTDSEYYSVIKFAVDTCKQCSCFYGAWSKCEEKFKKYNWIHAYPNIASEIVSLWFGNGDFDETMYICAMAGQDVDCNAAQIGTILGIINGKTGISSKWYEPIGDELITYLRDYKKINITELSKLTVEAIIRAKKC